MHSHACWRVGLVTLSHSHATNSDAPPSPLAGRRGTLAAAARRPRHNPLVSNHRSARTSVLTRAGSFGSGGSFGGGSFGGSGGGGSWNYPPGGAGGGGGAGDPGPVMASVLAGFMAAAFGEDISNITNGASQWEAQGQQQARGAGRWEEESDEEGVCAAQQWSEDEAE